MNVLLDWHGHVHWLETGSLFSTVSPPGVTKTLLALRGWEAWLISVLLQIHPEHFAVPQMLHIISATSAISLISFPSFIPSLIMILPVSVTESHPARTWRFDRIYIYINIYIIYIYIIPIAFPCHSLCLFLNHLWSTCTRTPNVIKNRPFVFLSCGVCASWSCLDVPRITAPQPCVPLILEFVVSTLL